MSDLCDVVRKRERGPCFVQRSAVGKRIVIITKVNSDPVVKSFFREKDLLPLAPKIQPGEFSLSIRSFL